MKVAEYKFKVEGNQLVVAIATESGITGSERTVSAGGGVRAKVIKTSEGKNVIQSFSFDRDRFNEERARTWMEKNSEKLTEAMYYVSMNAPKGSFEDMTLRVQRALNMQEGYEYAVVKFMFKDYAICDLNGDLYKAPFKDKSGRIEFGEFEEVSTEIVAKESQEFREKEERRLSDDVDFSATLKEATVNDEKREVVAVLIEAGTNYSKKRHYPKKTIQEAAGLFAGLKMYIDHPTDREDREKPERSVKDYVSIIKESWYDEGKAMGRIHIHDEWLWGKMKDPVFRESIGISINAAGSRYMKTIDGEQMEVIEKIGGARSVDWVTEAGARGRVEYLLESQEKQREQTMLKTITLTEFEGERKDLVQAIENRVREAMKGETQTAINAAVQEALKPYKEAEAEAAKKVRESKVKSLAEASRLPKKGIVKFVTKFLTENAEVADADLEKKVKEAIAAEIQYLNECGLGIKVGVESGVEEEKEIAEDGEVVVHEAAVGLLEHLGLAEKKKK